MSIEYEVKVIASIGEPLEYVQKHGLLLQSRTRMQRAVFTVEQVNGVKQYIRVRDEGKRVTLTLKKNDGTGTITSVSEWELVVQDFAKTCAFVQALGYTQAWTAQTYRSLWEFKNCFITCDEWPGLPPFLEIEGKTEIDVQRVIDFLGIDARDCMHGQIFDVYEKVQHIPQHAFENIMIIDDEHIAKLKKQYT